jgi:GGDEF domain-containing protein
MSPFVVVMSDHKHPKYFVARRMIGKDSFAIICTSPSEFNARQIATAMSATEKARAEEEQRNIVTLKQNRKRA